MTPQEHGPASQTTIPVTPEALAILDELPPSYAARYVKLVRRAEWTTKRGPDRPRGRVVANSSWLTTLWGCARTTVSSTLAAFVQHELLVPWRFPDSRKGLSAEYLIVHLADPDIVAAARVRLAHQGERRAARKAAQEDRARRRAAGEDLAVRVRGTKGQFAPRHDSQLVGHRDVVDADEPATSRCPTRPRHDARHDPRHDARRLAHQPLPRDSEPSPLTTEHASTSEQEARVEREAVHLRDEADEAEEAPEDDAVRAALVSAFPAAAHASDAQFAETLTFLLAVGANRDAVKDCHETWRRTGHDYTLTLPALMRNWDGIAAAHHSSWRTLNRESETEVTVNELSCAPEIATESIPAPPQPPSFERPTPERVAEILRETTGGKYGAIDAFHLPAVDDDPPARAAPDPRWQTPRAETQEEHHQS